jgi:hypothetical protein
MAAKPRWDASRVNFDPALGDFALAQARDALAQGNWEAPRDLLAGGRTATTGGRPDWDRRSHRVRVLAESVANSAWVESWQVLDPMNADAALLRAQVETFRVLRSAGGSAATVRESAAADALALCNHAAEMAPEDPTPWVVMLTLARAAGRTSAGSGRDEFWRRWQEMRRRDEFNRDGHHEALAYLCASWCGSHVEMYDFAYWLASQAPPGSPLAVLPLVAHAEAYRAMAAGLPARAQPSPHVHWENPQVVADVDRVLRSWLGSASVTHAQADMDRNYLLHALVFSGRGHGPEARALFEAVGSHATRIPWTYTGDAETSFLYWRQQAFEAG